MAGDDKCLGRTETWAPGGMGMAIYSVQVAGWMLAGVLVLLGVWAVWFSWRQWLRVNRSDQPSPVFSTVHEPTPATPTGQSGEPFVTPAAPQNASWRMTDWLSANMGQLSRTDRRYFRWRTGLRMATGLLLILCGILLAYLGGAPLGHLEELFQETLRAPERIGDLRTAENQAQLRQTLFWVAMLGLCALLLITVALAELTITWLYGWHKRWELHQAQRAYLSHQAAEAVVQRLESPQPSPPPVAQKE